MFCFKRFELSYECDAHAAELWVSLHGYSHSLLCPLGARRVRQFELGGTVNAYEHTSIVQHSHRRPSVHVPAGQQLPDHDYHCTAHSTRHHSHHVNWPRKSCLIREAPTPSPVDVTQRGAVQEH